MKKLFTAVCAIISLHAVSVAQRTYFEADISKEIFKNFELSVTPQLRFKEGFELKEYMIDAGVEYKFNKYFKAGGSYRFGTNITKSGNHEYFGRFTLDAKTGIKWKRFEPKFRFRYTNNNEDFGSENLDIFNYFRYKFEIEYKIKKLDLNPYIYTELFQNLSQSNLNTTRYEGGLEYEINKHNKIGAYFRMNFHKDTSDPVNIIGLSYKLKL